MIRSALLPSLVRTLVPLIVGWVLSLPLTPVVLDVLAVTTADAGRAVTAAATAVITAVYYVAVRWLETHGRPRLGWLLGWAAQPTDYAAAADLTAREEISRGRGW